MVDLQRRQCLFLAMIPSLATGVSLTYGVDVDVDVDVEGISVHWSGGLAVTREWVGQGQDGGGTMAQSPRACAKGRGQGDAMAQKGERQKVVLGRM